MRQSRNCLICSNTVAHAELMAKKVRCNVRCFEDREFTVWRCPHCQSLHSQDNVNLSEYYANYPLKKEKFDYFRKRIFQNRLHLLLQQGLKKEDKILDYGCNQGLFIKFLQQKGYKNAVGYDPYVEQFSDLNILQKQYNYITCQDVIEHTENPQQCLSELASCLIKNGTLILGTPNAEEIRLDQTDAFLLHLHQPYHRHILSEQALLNLAASLSLKPSYRSIRWVNDSLYPFVNTRLSWAYAIAIDNNIDVFFEPIQLLVLLTSLKLLFYAFWGYFFPIPGNLILVFHKN